MSTSSRKDEHLKINLSRDVKSGLSTGFDSYRFIHQALPEIDFAMVDTHTKFFGKILAAPILISSMTGGSGKTAPVNQVLAQAAQKFGLAMGLGSMRAALEDKDVAESFKVRKSAPDILLFANLGAVQLNYSYTIEHCKRIIDLASADGLILHLNPLQEALQPEGDTNFSGLLSKIEILCKSINSPVILKEVGWGIDGETAKKLADAGVSAIDCAGAGGTSWSQVEMYRHRQKMMQDVAGSFKGWGITTTESLIQVHQSVPKLPLIASGGLRNGIDLAKSIALGAQLGGFAGIIFKAAWNGPEKLADEIKTIITELRIAMFASGAVDMHKLGKTKLLRQLDG